jgi:hypothetical protein
MEIISEKRYVDVKRLNRFQKVAIAVARTRASRRDSCDTANVVKDKGDWRKKPYIAIPQERDIEQVAIQMYPESSPSRSSMNVSMRKKIETPFLASGIASDVVPNSRKEYFLNNKLIENEGQKHSARNKVKENREREIPLTPKSATTRSVKARIQNVVNTEVQSSTDIVLTGRVTSTKAIEGEQGSVNRSHKAELKRRNSTAALSMHDEDLSPLFIERKRRNSMSALTSLSLGEMQLSPFRRNSPMYKRGSAKKKTSSRRLLEIPLPLVEDDISCRSRKVAFVVQSDGTIQTDVVESNLTLSEDEVKTLWWSKPERRAMKRKAQKIAIKFLSVTAKYHLAVEQILYQCGNMTQKDRHAFFSEREALRFLIHHDARGLELAMISSLGLPSCKMYHKSCKNSVKEVLNTQAMVKGKSVDDQVHMIAAQYKQAVAIATQFARILAEGDQRVARGAYVKMNRTDDASILTPALTEESSLSTSSSTSDEDLLDGSFTI